jgi:hypothetical protein
VADPFKVRLDDDPAIKPQARESAYGWAGDRVEVALDNLSTKVQQQAGSGGLFEIPSDTSLQATVTNASRAGSYRSAVIWRKASGAGATIATGVEQKLVVSTRLRMSIWAFTPPFTQKFNGSDIVLDTGLLSLLTQANIDDLSLVWTIGWDERARRKDKAKPPKWHGGFLPAGSAAHREPYLRKLIDALHKMNVQVLAGYELVKASKKLENLTAADKMRNAHAQDFADWLLGASPSEIDDYARSINAFFETKGLDVDGVGFDFEFDELKETHKANLALLYQKTSEAIAHRNGIVSYANAPFLEDGVSQNGFTKAQPFSIAASGLNLLARPMCFDSTDSSSVSVIESSIACALRRPKNLNDPNDKTPAGGAGLHPSQVQFAIWADKVAGGLEKLCSDVLRPNRIGLLIYNLPPESEKARTLLTNCQKWNLALNPNEAPPGQAGQPLQVPRAAGPFRATMPEAPTGTQQAGAGKGA